MLRSIRAQLRAIRAELTGYSSEERAPQIDVIRGGLPGGSIRAMAPGGHTWERGADEAEADFEARVISEACRLGVPVTISGCGLPQLYRMTPQEREHRFRFVPNEMLKRPLS